MSKNLKLLAQRNTEIKVHVDLRGLGKEAVYKESYPFSSLSIVCRTRDMISTDFLESYKLEIISSRYNNVLHLVSTDRKEGMHRQHSAIHVFAVLELLQKKVINSYLLHYVQPLGFILRNSYKTLELGIDSQIDSSIENWVADSYCSSVSEEVAVVLNGSGFPCELKYSSPICDQDIKAINEFVQSLACSAEGSSKGCIKYG